MISQINPVTGHALVLMSGGVDGLMGRIRLTNGAADAGYVYLDDTPVTPRLGGPDTTPYVVMSRSGRDLAGLLAFLTDGRPKTIRYAGQARAGGSAFLEHDEGGSAADPEPASVVAR